MIRESLIKHWECVEAFKNGRTLEVRQPGSNNWSECPEPCFFTNCDYRIKPEPPPKKRVPLGMDDVPLGSTVREMGDKRIYTVISTGPAGFGVGREIISFERAMVLWEMVDYRFSTQDPHWIPMWKEVDA